MEYTELENITNALASYDESVLERFKTIAEFPGKALLTALILALVPSQNETKLVNEKPLKKIIPDPFEYFERMEITTEIKRLFGKPVAAVFFIESASISKFAAFETAIKKHGINQSHYMYKIETFVYELAEGSARTATPECEISS